MTMRSISAHLVDRIISTFTQFMVKAIIIRALVLIVAGSGKNLPSINGLANQ